jgi:asparagine synthetase B (glutamine-hydrolysing)
LLAGGGIDTSIDPVALHHHMSWHAVVPAPLAILAGVRKLALATVATFERDGTRRDIEYRRLSVRADPRLEALEAREGEVLVERALSTAVRRRMVADVPVGVLLSGGAELQSDGGAARRAWSRRAADVSIAFESAYGEAGDEFVDSERIAEHFGTDHRRIRVPMRDLIDALPATIAAMSEPMVSYDGVGFFLLSREVARHVKVVQSGQGADEAFAGYSASRFSCAASGRLTPSFYDLGGGRGRRVARVGRRRRRAGLRRQWRDRRGTEHLSIRRHLVDAGFGRPVRLAFDAAPAQSLPAITASFIAATCFASIGATPLRPWRRATTSARRWSASPSMRRTATSARIWTR